MGGIGEGWRKELSETSFSVIPQGSSGMQSVRYVGLTLRQGSWPFITTCQVSGSLGVGGWRT